MCFILFLNKVVGFPGVFLHKNSTKVLEFFSVQTDKCVQNNAKQDVAAKVAEHLFAPNRHVASTHTPTHAPTPTPTLPHTHATRSPTESKGRPVAAAGSRDGASLPSKAPLPQTGSAALLESPVDCPKRRRIDEALKLDTTNQASVT